MKKININRALISVYDKTGVAHFAQRLSENGCKILSTGGTGTELTKASIPFKEISAHTGFPEIMGGRVKSLHPLVHGGILSRRELDSEVVAKHNILEIDLVVVNFYPFVETISESDCTFDRAIENIDIGGPNLIRAAAKNHKHVLVVVDPDDYEETMDRIESENVDSSFRNSMAAKAFRYTAAYDAAIAEYLSSDVDFPETLTLNFHRASALRYGENPHQRASFYIKKPSREGSISVANQLQGKELSYNNIADADAALECVKQFNDTACVIVKHGNPCGAALGENSKLAYMRAFDTDPTSAFGGIVAFNRTLNAPTMNEIIDSQFAEVVIAPHVSEEAKEASHRRKSLRVLESGDWSGSADAMHFKQVSGGLLLQDVDSLDVEEIDLRCVTNRQPSEAEMKDLRFAWIVAWFVKSNAIVFAKDQRTIGIGAGQMSRVISAKIAALKASEEGLPIERSVMASDAFFPFRDGVDSAANAGITAVIQPGGSIRDEEVVDAANEHGMAMVFTGIRHFRH